MATQAIISYFLRERKIIENLLDPLESLDPGAMNEFRVSVEKLQALFAFCGQIKRGNALSATLYRPYLKSYRCCGRIREHQQRKILLNKWENQTKARIEPLKRRPGWAISKLRKPFRDQMANFPKMVLDRSQAMLEEHFSSRDPQLLLKLEAYEDKLLSKTINLLKVTPTDFNRISSLVKKHYHITSLASKQPAKQLLIWKGTDLKKMNAMLDERNGITQFEEWIANYVKDSKPTRGQKREFTRWITSLQKEQTEIETSIRKTYKIS